MRKGPRGQSAAVPGADGRSFLGRSHARPTRGVGAGRPAPAELPRPSVRRRCRARRPRKRPGSSSTHTPDPAPQASTRTHVSHSSPPPVTTRATTPVVVVPRIVQPRRRPGRAQTVPPHRRQQQAGQHPDAGSAPPRPSARPVTPVARPPPRLRIRSRCRSCSGSSRRTCFALPQRGRRGQSSRWRSSAAELGGDGCARGGELRAVAAVEAAARGSLDEAAGVGAVLGGGACERRRRRAADTISPFAATAATRTVPCSRDWYTDAGHPQLDVGERAAARRRKLRRLTLGTPTIRDEP